MNLSIIILALVTAERLFELWLSNRHTRRLLARGAHEIGARHYPLIVAVHSGWLAALWWLAPPRAVNLPLLALFLLLQVGRFWVIRTLGQRWTTRIIVLPGEPLIDLGPYRLVRHPNYVIVVGEIAVLPMVFGLWRVALIFSVLNAAVLWLRISAEEKALAPSRRVSQPPPRPTP